MYNLLVSGKGWEVGHNTMRVERLFEYTTVDVEDHFTVNGQVDFRGLASLPTLFVPEIRQPAERTARVGSIRRASFSGATIDIEYLIPPHAPVLTYVTLEALAVDLDIAPLEFTRTHWAVKNVDLLQVLQRSASSCRYDP